MGRVISYEWDIETIDPATDEIEDHNHYDNIPAKPMEPHQRLVLVRDDCAGNPRRAWAYVENGKLPTHFADSLGEPVCPVPVRFHNEFKKSIHHVS